MFILSRVITIAILGNSVFHTFHNLPSCDLHLLLLNVVFSGKIKIYMKNLIDTNQMLKNVFFTHKKQIQMS